MVSLPSAKRPAASTAVGCAAGKDNPDHVDTQALEDEFRIAPRRAASSFVIRKLNDMTESATSKSIPGTPFERIATAAGNEQNRLSKWPTIAHRDQIPKWLRDNDYILTGHPMPTHSYKKSYRLWRCLHMETMNIWTHSLGSAAFVATGLALVSSSQSAGVSSLEVGDRLAFGSFIASAALCFGLSTTFHTLRSHSYHVHHLWGKMDILGICVLALGSGTSATYYAFYEDDRLQNLYWTLSVCSSSVAVYTLFDTGGGGSKMRSLRGSVFSLLAVSAMLPIIQTTSSLGWSEACHQVGTHWFLAEAIVLLFGVAAFVGRFPERFSPGTFDIWGHSHQIFHICAVLGTGFQLKALLTAYTFRRTN